MIRIFIATVILCVLSGASLAGCPNLVLGQPGINNLYNDLGVRYTPLSGKYMSPCLTHINHNKYSYNHSTGFRFPDTATLVVFFPNGTALKQNERGRDTWNIRTWVTHYTQSHGPSIEAGFARLRAKAGTRPGSVQKKKIILPTRGYGKVTFTIIHRSEGDEVRALAFFEIPPPVNSMAYHSGVKRIGGQTRDIFVSPKNEHLTAWQLRDALNAVTQPALSQNVFATLQAN